MQHLFGVFLSFSFAVMKPVCMGFHTSAIADPPMGIITVSCKGSVLLRNTQSAVLSLVFPDLCVSVISSRETKRSSLSKALSVGVLLCDVLVARPAGGSVSVPLEFGSIWRGPSPCPCCRGTRVSLPWAVYGGHSLDTPAGLRVALGPLSLWPPLWGGSTRASTPSSSQARGPRQLCSSRLPPWSWSWGGWRGAGASPLPPAAPTRQLQFHFFAGGRTAPRIAVVVYSA